MREEDSNWFAKWEDELPSPEELMPLSQTLITPDLALAFNIRNPNNPNHFHAPPHAPPHLHQNHSVNTAANSPQPNSSAEFDSDLVGTGGTGAGASESESARTLKRPRLVWTPQLHKRFVDAVAHLGIKNAVPKTIMQLMSVDGLTRENVASHLQKYRLYLKRMQGINNGGNGNSGGGLSGSSGVDSAMDRLFASAPVPAHFLRPNSDHYIAYPPVTMQVHHPQMVVQPPNVGHAQQIQQQFRHLGNSPPNGQFEHPFLGRQSQQQVQRIGTPIHGNGNGHRVMPNSYVEGVETTTAAANGRKVLTLFPNGD